MFQIDDCFLKGYFVCCESVAHAIQVINDPNTHKCVLICNGKQGQELINLVHFKENVRSIHVFTGQKSVEMNKLLEENFAKVKQVTYSFT